MLPGASPLSAPAGFLRRTCVSGEVFYTRVRVQMYRLPESSRPAPVRPADHARPAPVLPAPRPDCPCLPSPSPARLPISTRACPTCPPYLALARPARLTSPRPFGPARLPVSFLPRPGPIRLANPPQADPSRANPLPTCQFSPCLVTSSRTDHPTPAIPCHFDPSRQAAPRPAAPDPTD